MNSLIGIAALRAYAVNFTDLMHSNNSKKCIVKVEDVLADVDALLDQIATLEDRLEAVRFGGAR